MSICYQIYADRTHFLSLLDDPFQIINNLKRSSSRKCLTLKLWRIVHSLKIYCVHLFFQESALLAGKSMNRTTEQTSSSSSDTVVGLPRVAMLGPSKGSSFQSSDQIVTTHSMQSPEAVTISPSNSSKTEMVDYAELSPRVGSVVSSNQVDFFLTLAQNFVKKRLYSTALDYYSRALRIENKTAATNDTDRLLMADILFEIGHIHLKLQDLSRAIYTFDVCQSIRRQLLNWDDERNAAVLHQQARIYSMVGDSESAVRALEELLGILCCSGTNVHLLQETWLELARHQDKLGLHAEANSSRKEAKQL